MTPTKNELAERMNWTLKEEYGLGEIIQTKQLAYQLVEEAAYLYNHKRPHSSLGYQTPEQVHKKSLIRKYLIREVLNILIRQLSSGRFIPIEIPWTAPTRQLMASTKGIRTSYGVIISVAAIYTTSCCRKYRMLK